MITTLSYIKKCLDKADKSSNNNREEGSGVDTQPLTFLSYTGCTEAGRAIASPGAELHYHSVSRSDHGY